MNNSFSGFIRVSCFILALFVPAAWSQTGLGAGTTQAPGPPPQNMPPQPGPPQIGSINYVEGDASVANNPARPGLVLGRDQILTTRTGKVEVLLTPGVFLRLGDNSAVRMVSPDLATTRVELQKGRALVDVAEISKENDIRVDQNGASTKLLKPGLYEFDADHAQVRVFKGKADVEDANEKTNVGDKHQITLMAGVRLKASDFEP